MQVSFFIDILFNLITIDNKKIIMIYSSMICLLNLIQQEREMKKFRPKNI